jgi:hypothetical protein
MVAEGKAVAKKESVRSKKFRKWLKTRDYFFLTPAVFGLIALVSLFLVWFAVPEVRVGSSLDPNAAVEKANLAFNGFGSEISGAGAKYGSPTIPNPAVPYYFGVMLLVIIMSLSAFLLDGVGMIVVNLTVLPLLALSYFPMFLSGVNNYFVGGLYRFTTGKFGGNIEAGIGFYLFGLGLTAGFLLSLVSVILRVRKAKKQAALVTVTS